MMTLAAEAKGDQGKMNTVPSVCPYATAILIR
jgi:hypothetical protein